MNVMIFRSEVEKLYNVNTVSLLDVPKLLELLDKLLDRLETLESRVERIDDDLCEVSSR